MPLRLLNVIAHPDDECFAFGGALATAADGGVETSVLCFTDGAAGSYRGDAGSAEELGQLRRKEFAASCNILGVAHHELLGYPDGKLAESPLTVLAAEVIRRIRAFRPHVVLTFGMDGAANTHPDHTAASAAATAAFHWAGTVDPATGAAKRFPELGAPWQAQRLYHQTTSVFLPDRPQPLPAPWTLTLDIAAAFERKKAAFLAHTTQAPLAKLAVPFFESHPKIELYTLMASLTPHAAAQSTDMFEGVTATD